MPQLFEPQLYPKLTQGDVFRSDWDDDQASPLGPVVVFSHGCEIDKPKIPTIHIATIVPQATTGKGDWGDIVKGRVAHAFWLEGCDEPGYVDLRTLRPVVKDLFRQRLDRRMHSMNAEGRIAMSLKLFAFLTRVWPPPETIGRMVEETAGQSQG